MNTDVDLTDPDVHQQRDHAVPCRRCHKPTFATNALCEVCTTKAA